MGLIFKRMVIFKSFESGHCARNTSLSWIRHESMSNTEQAYETFLIRHESMSKTEQAYETFSWIRHESMSNTEQAYETFIWI